MIAFGPVPSRRLGRIPGINNITPKHGTYSCIHCQVGPATDMSLERRCFYQPETILTQVRDQLGRIREPVDRSTFAAGGEPTVDRWPGRTIDVLRSFGLPIAMWSLSNCLCESHPAPRNNPRKKRP